MTTTTVIFCQCPEGKYPATFRNFGNGETMWDCVECGGVVVQYQDCLGG